MPDCSSRLCSWALGGLMNACRRGTVSDICVSLEECSSRLTKQISQVSGILKRNRGVDCGYRGKTRSESLGCVGILTERGIWQTNVAVSSIDVRLGGVNGRVDKGISPTFTGGSLFLPRQFGSSASYLVAHRCESTGNKFRLKPEGQSRLLPNGETGRRIQFKSKISGEPVGKKRFSGALSSVKDVQSNHTRENFQTAKRFSKTRSKRGIINRAVGPTRSVRKLGQIAVAKERGKLRFSKKFKAEDRPGDNGERTKRTRKRIRAHPRDLTFKRGLDAPEMGQSVLAPAPKAREDKPLSASAKFRQIEPSRELLRQIEENLLGRRRLLEWRRAGFDPTRNAPLDDVPESNERRSPIQETVFRQKLTFIAAAKIASSLPPTQYTEIAFAGRSNVGKSSLINALTRQWGVARTSDKPGLTQTINFFTLGSELCLVDLPGYGFAFAKAQVKEDWEELVKEYVTARSNLKRVCLLVDAKWGLKPRDQELLQLMESSRTRYQIILTKTDVLPPLDLARRATQILQTLKDHRCLVQPLMMVSSKSGAGLIHLRASLARVVLGYSRVLPTGQRCG